PRLLGEGSMRMPAVPPGVWYANHALGSSVLPSGDAATVCRPGSARRHGRGASGCRVLAKTNSAERAEHVLERSSARAFREGSLERQRRALCVIATQLCDQARGFVALKRAHLNRGETSSGSQQGLVDVADVRQVRREQDLASLRAHDPVRDGEKAMQVD